MSRGKGIALPTSRLAKWNSMPVPLSGEQLHAANWSRHCWEVFREGAGIEVRPIEEGADEGPKPPLDDWEAHRKFIIHKEAGRRMITWEVADGFLVGLYGGEWGGSLHWCSRDGSRSYRVSRDNPLAFAAIEETIYCVEGCHDGRLVEIRRAADSGRWRSRCLVELDPVGRAITVDASGRLLVASDNGIHRYTPATGSLERLAEAKWWALYLNSIVLDRDGTAYVGMRQGVARVRLSQQPVKEDWMFESPEILERDMERAYGD